MDIADIWKTKKTLATKNNYQSLRKRKPQAFVS
jgi:hypothetical protein